MYLIKTSFAFAVSRATSKAEKEKGYVAQGKLSVHMDSIVMASMGITG